MLPIAGLIVVSLGSAGCAGGMDAITSRKFRQDPFNTTYRMWNPEDPLLVLRADPPREGDERARAMLRLKEPRRAKGTPEEQDWVIDLLARTATADPSPVLRAAAIGALGRFEDQRATGILMVAYQKAHGRPEGVAAPAADLGVVNIGATGRSPGRSLAAIPLSGPVGFPPDQATVLRCACLESLGRTGRPETIPFLAAVANGPTADTAPEGADDREVRLAAVRGLGACRQPEAVYALSQVLAAEAGKDTALAGGAHRGLVSLTGKRLPPDPRQWDAVVQAGVTIAPEPNWIQTAIEWSR